MPIGYYCNKSSFLSELRKYLLSFGFESTNSIHILQGIYLLGEPTYLASSREVVEAARFMSSFPIALKFDRHVGSGAVEIPVKFQGNTIIIIPNVATSRLHEILRHDVRQLSE